MHAKEKTLEGIKTESIIFMALILNMELVDFPYEIRVFLYQIWKICKYTEAIKIDAELKLLVFVYFDFYINKSNKYLLNAVDGQFTYNRLKELLFLINDDILHNEKITRATWISAIKIKTKTKDLANISNLVLAFFNKLYEALLKNKEEYKHHPQEILDIHNQIMKTYNNWEWANRETISKIDLQKSHQVKKNKFLYDKKNIRIQTIKCIAYDCFYESELIDISNNGLISTSEINLENLIKKIWGKFYDKCRSTELLVNHYTAIKIENFSQFFTRQLQSRKHSSHKDHRLIKRLLHDLFIFHNKDPYSYTRYSNIWINRLNHPLGIPEFDLEEDRFNFGIFNYYLGGNPTTRNEEILFRIKSKLYKPTLYNIPEMLKPLYKTISYPYDPQHSI